MITEELQELIDRLIGTDGVESVSIRTSVDVTVKKKKTGELDNVFNPIRKRAVPEDELEVLSSDLSVNYLGVVDSMNDFHVKDRFRLSERIED